MSRPKLQHLFHQFNTRKQLSVLELFVTGRERLTVEGELFFNPLACDALLDKLGHTTSGEFACYSDRLGAEKLSSHQKKLLLGTIDAFLSKVS